MRKVVRAAAGQFDATFTPVQAVELAAGATNVALLGPNVRDGIARARGWPVRKSKKAARLVGP